MTFNVFLYTIIYFEVFIYTKFYNVSKNTCHIYHIVGPKTHSYQKNVGPGVAGNMLLAHKFLFACMAC